jgi:hypothetical protein
MASLTTVYMISMILTSAMGIASAFVGNRIFPLKGGSEPIVQPQPAPIQTQNEVPTPQNTA